MHGNVYNLIEMNYFIFARYVRMTHKISYLIKTCLQPCVCMFTYKSNKGLDKVLKLNRRLSEEKRAFRYYGITIKHTAGGKNCVTRSERMNAVGQRSRVVHSDTKDGRGLTFA